MKIASILEYVDTNWILDSKKSQKQNGIVPFSTPPTHPYQHKYSSRWREFADKKSDEKGFDYFSVHLVHEFDWPVDHIRGKI